MDQQQDLNLASFLRDLRKGWAFIIGGAVIGSVGAFLFMFSAIAQYRGALMVAPAYGPESFAQTISPAQDTRGQSVNAYGSQGRSDAGAHFVHFEAIYAGVSVAENLLRDRRIVQGLSSDQRYRFGSRNEQVWNAQLLSDYIGKRVWRDRFGESAIQTLHYEHRDPNFAAFFLQQIHRSADQIIRSGIRSQVDQRISYLERAIGKTYNPDHKRAMAGLLLEQERIRMLVSMDEPVAAKVVEKAAVYAKPSWPNGYFAYIGFVLLGGVLGYVVACLRYAMRDEALRQDVAGAKDVQHGHAQKRPRNYASWFRHERAVSNDPQKLFRDDVRDAAE